MSFTNNAPRAGVSQANLTAAINDVLDGALDRLNKLAAALGDAANYAATVTAVLSNKLDKDGTQVLNTNDFTDTFKSLLQNVNGPD